MSPARTIGLVAKREIQTRAFSKGALWSVGITVVIIVAGIIVASIFMNRESDAEAQDFAVTSQTEALGQALAAISDASGEPLELTTVGTDEEARSLVEEGDAVAGLAGSLASPVLYSGDDTPAAMEPMLTSAAGQVALNQAIVDLGGDPAAVQQDVAAVQVEVTYVGDDDGFDPAAYIVSFAVIMLMFYLIMMTGQQIAAGVVEEKQSRIVEILLATVRPWELLAGKVLGIGLIGFVQVFIFLAAAVGAASATGVLGGIDVPINSVLVWSIVWLIAGFLLYATLWGGTASLVSRQEDIGQAIAPLMILMFIPFYASMFVVVYDPSGLVAQIMTYVPFFAPFTVPVRVSYGEISTGEILIALGITALAIVACTWLAGRIYQRGILHIGSRLEFSQIFARS